MCSITFIVIHKRDTPPRRQALKDLVLAQNVLILILLQLYDNLASLNFLNYPTKLE